MKLDTIGQYLDHGFYIISANRAGRLCKAFNGLPRSGYERLIIVDGKRYWIARTLHNCAQVWSIREA